MIGITSKKDCSGCAACSDICPRDCIAMEVDLEGFMYPEVDVSKCINCGLCDRVCPILNVPRQNEVRDVIAAKNRTESERFHSSSGGVFCLLAEKVFEEGGVVVGCRFNDKMEAEHALIEDVSELDALMSSKYVQSDTVGIYKKVREFLREGRMVLFSGVPCQVAAVKNFIVKPYDNLITVDVLCHGVPSPKLFREYRERLEMRYGGKIRSLNFRWKEKSWKRLYINVVFNNMKRHFLYSGYDSYMQLFLSDRLQRSSCFSCPYNNLHRPGDISLGDFWGIGKTHYEFDDNKGVSMVLINNLHGRALWEKISENTLGLSSDIETAVDGNKVLVKHLPSIAKRDEFYEYYTANGFDRAIAKFAPESSRPHQLYYNFMRWGRDIVRKMKREGY